MRACAFRSSVDQEYRIFGIRRYATLLWYCQLFSNNFLTVGPAVIQYRLLYSTHSVDSVQIERCVRACEMRTRSTAQTCGTVYQV
jgi:hypothetical protein